MDEQQNNEQDYNEHGYNAAETLTDKDFPKMVYHHNEKPLTVYTPDQFYALHEDWKTSPALVTKPKDVAEVDKRTPFEKLTEIAQEAVEYRASIDAEKAAVDHERNMVASERGQLNDQRAEFERAKAEFTLLQNNKDKKVK